MEITIRGEIVVGAAIALGVAFAVLAGVIIVMGIDAFLAGLLDIALDIFEKFLRLPERQIV